MTAVARRLWLIVGGALILTAILVFLSGRNATARVPVVDVVRENLSSVVSSNGKVEPEAPRSFRAEVPTFVDKVYVVEGQQVKRGQALFSLGRAATEAELAQARADLAAQQATLANAKEGGHPDQLAKVSADLRKAQITREQLRAEGDSLIKLVTQKAATSQELEQNQVALHQADADIQSLEKMKQVLGNEARIDSGRVGLLVEHAQNQVRDLDHKIKSTTGIAPFDGTLYSLPIHRGDFVKEGDLLAEVADLHHVRVRAFIDEPELGKIDVNQPVDILWDAHPDRVWSGRTEVLPKQVVMRGSRSVGELLCSVSNDQLDLIPNTSVDVRIHISERPNVLAIPRGAVYIEGSKRFVFVLDKDRLHRRDIQVGIANPTMIEVLSGLREGDVVGLPGDVALKENLHIQAVRPE